MLKSGWFPFVAHRYPTERAEIVMRVRCKPPPFYAQWVYRTPRRPGQRAQVVLTQLAYPLPHGHVHLTFWSRFCWDFDAILPKAKQVGYDGT